MAKLTFDVKKMIRPCCAGFEPYVAGKPVESIRRELGLKRVIKLASNENPLGPSKKAVAAMKRACEKVYFYPDAGSYELRRAIARKFKVEPASVMLGCGSDEIIEILARVFFKPDDEIVASQHAFIRYKMAGDLMGCRVIEVPMKDYTHDLAAMARAVTPKTKAVFIANPNNPTGTYNTRQEFEAFLRAVKARVNGVCPPLIILDEAYYEFARPLKDYPETLSYLAENPNLVILRTFSKIYALAGLRVGYGFASPAVTDFVDRVRPPFNVNSMAQAAALASLGDDSQVAKSVKLVRSQMKYLVKELGKLGLACIPSAANFVLVDVAPLGGQELFRALLRKGIIVRAMDEYRYPTHVRVSIGLPAENRSFVQKLKELISVNKG